MTSTIPGADEETATDALHQHECIATPSSVSDSRINGSTECIGAERAGGNGSARLTRSEVSLREEHEAAGATPFKNSLLTLLVAEHFALTTPDVPLASKEQQVENAALYSGDNSDKEEVIHADAESGGSEDVGQASRHKKRNRRALFAAGDEDADQGSNTQEDTRLNFESIAQQEQCDQSSHALEDIQRTIGSSPDAITPEQEQQKQKQHQKDDELANAQLLEEEAKAVVDTLVRKRAPPHEIWDLDSSTTTRNAFDDEPDDEPTLLIRKKWKRNLHQTQSGVLLPFSTLADAHQQSLEDEGFFSLSQPSRPSFTRSMSSHSVFISKPSPSTPNSISSKPPSIGSASSSTQPGEGEVHQLVLPTIRSASHPDLNVISPQTVSRLLNGDFKAQLGSYALIDCRFAYEHGGGSLKGAQSLCDPASVEQKFLWNPPKDCKRTALVFYCEFSANRAPKMLRHVRNLDRWIHAEKYPELFYPELYLVDGGYKNCFETIKEEICEPQSYMPMNHQDFVGSCKREFALWRKRWKAHKTSVCAAKFQLHHHKKRQTTSSSLRSGNSGDGGRNGAAGRQDTQDETEEKEEDFALDLPALHPPVTLRSFSEML